MKIIRMPNPASIVRFLKRLLLVIVVLFIVRIAASFMFTEDYYTVYESDEAVIKMFRDNRKDFVELIDILESTDVTEELFKEFMEEGKNKCLQYPRSQLKGRKSINKEQREFICYFFEKYGVHVIEGKNGCYDMDFFTKTTDMSIHYVKKTNEAAKERYLDYIRSHNDKVVHLGGYWYYDTSKSDVVREIGE